MTSSSTHLVNAAFVYFSLNMFLNVLKYAINVKKSSVFWSPNSLKNQICVQWDVGGRGTTTKTNCWIDVRQAVVSLPCFSLPLLRLSIFVFWFSRVFQTLRRRKRRFLCITASTHWLPVLLGLLTSDIPPQLYTVCLFHLFSPLTVWECSSGSDTWQPFKHAWTE